MIKDGSARLLGEQNGRLSTIFRLNAGSFVGLASLLRGAPCEEVRASTELVAYSITDDELLDLIEKNQPIAEACQRHLWEAELAALIK